MKQYHEDALSEKQHKEVGIKVATLDPGSDSNSTFTNGPLMDDKTASQ